MTDKRATGDADGPAAQDTTEIRLIESAVDGGSGRNEPTPPIPSFRSLMRPEAKPSEIDIVADVRRNAYLRFGDRRTLYRLDSPKAKALLTQHAAARGTYLRPGELREWSEQLSVFAQVAPETHDVWLRVAPFGDGLEIDVGDEEDRRIRVTPGRVRVVADSDTFFHRTQPMQPFVLPANEGDLGLLDKYLRLSASDCLLIKVWCAYTLANPKRAGTMFPLLVISGGQGVGKTSLCRIIQSLVDPNTIGVQSFPRHERDFAVASQMSHLVLYDNVRWLRLELSDLLCRSATRSELALRKLYSDSDVVTLTVHGPVVLNGIHESVRQSDLAERCLRVNLLPMDETDRRSERELNEEFRRDLPRIFRGLLDLIAGALLHLPAAKVTCPERAIDFVRWLAAIERFHGSPGDPYQTAYREAMRRGLRDSLEEMPIAAAVFDLVDGVNSRKWTGTPTELLQAINARVGARSRGSQDWPQTPISVSKRLRPLVPALRRQGRAVEFSRGRGRRITITFMGVPDDE